MNSIQAGNALVPPGALRTEATTYTESEIEAKISKYRAALYAAAGLKPRQVSQGWGKGRTNDVGGKPHPTAASVLFGERIAEARERSGLTNKAFAALGGVTPPYVCQCIRGQVKNITSRLKEAAKIWEVDLTGLSEAFTR